MDCLQFLKDLELYDWRVIPFVDQRDREPEESVAYMVASRFANIAKNSH